MEGWEELGDNDGRLTNEEMEGLHRDRGNGDRWVIECIIVVLSLTSCGRWFM